ncbi:CLIP domain-containing serine protease HP8-like [Anopheles bellator]|uniref:CLIP domain-containing serine protease HP8-like n=1 Tax=Anopheles bellator TaxID=139047 RepID=UPI0026498FAE|nr:CLIP domain-containing serine protease HP8-like [Anopheles bellator]
MRSLLLPEIRFLSVLPSAPSSPDSTDDSLPTVAEFNECTEDETCINIEDCTMFGPHFTEPAEWSDELKVEFRQRLCKRESINGVHVYKVCCPPVLITRSGLRGSDLLNFTTCGAHSENRIAHGKNAELFQFPWMALLQKNVGKFVCGATLIAERYVLTAAHCVQNDDIVSVRLGEFDLHNTTDCDSNGEECAMPVQDIPVERIIKHDDYSHWYKRNDIALIRLSQKASLNDNVIPICLPIGPQMRTTTNNYIVAGWGTTHDYKPAATLQYAILTLVSTADCQSQLQIIDPSVKLDENQLCAIGANLSDNCSGDSGGPLKTISVSGQFVQYGVVSFGLNTCGKLSAPGVYTRVESYIDWILENMEN